RNPSCLQNDEPLQRKISGITDYTSVTAVGSLDQISFIRYLTLHRTPRFHTSTTLRLARMSCVGFLVGDEFLNWANFARVLSDPIFPLREYQRDQLSWR